MITAPPTKRQKKASPNILVASLAISIAPSVACEQHLPQFDLRLHFDSQGGDKSAVSSQSKWGNIASRQVTSLDTPLYEVLKPIPIIVEQIDEHDFLATFFEAQIAASGETEEQSVVMLKDMLIGQLEHLEAVPVAILGRHPKRQLSNLRSHIKKRA